MEKRRLGKRKVGDKHFYQRLFPYQLQYQNINLHKYDINAHSGTIKKQVRA